VNGSTLSRPRLRFLNRFCNLRVFANRKHIRITPALLPHALPARFSLMAHAVLFDRMTLIPLAQISPMFDDRQFFQRLALTDTDCEPPDAI
jgi:hypothetical protein